jgi:hypothetical protein
MKKIIIAAALFTSTGILASCKKEVAVSTTANVQQSSIVNKKDVGTAD